MKYIDHNYKKGGTQKDFYSSKDVETVNCLICNSKEKSLIHREFGNIGIVKCNACGLLYTNPRPKKIELNYHGNIKNYFEEYKYILNGSKPHHRDRNYIQEINIIKKYFISGKLVDVGCNAGRFLYLAQKSGFNSVGVEPSKPLAKIGVENFKLNIKNCTLEDSDFLPKSIEIITAIDVFEHLTNPKSFLLKSYEFLKDDGILVIKVPNGNYTLTKFKIAKFLRKNTENMDIFDSYEHVAHFNKKTFEKIISNNNFKIQKIYAPLPIHPPLWAKYYGQYYLHSSPWYWDWKKVIMRKVFHFIGKIELFFNMSLVFQPDILYVLKKK